MEATTGKPLAENEHVQKFFTVLQDNNSQSTNELTAILGQLSTMEKLLSSAVDELATMRLQLAEVEAKKHSVRHVLKSACSTSLSQVSAMSEKLSELKNDFISSFTFCERQNVKP